MKLAKTDLLDALRLRYDHYSAQSVFEMTLAHAKLPDQAHYDEAQLATFRSTLKRVGDRVDKVDARIDALLAAPAPAPAPEPAPAAPAKAAPAKAAPAKAARIETTITLAGVPADEGDTILICGGLGAIGDWDPEKAAAMQRDGSAWHTTIEVPPDVDAQFKFLRRTADGTVIWEDGDNRALVARPRIDATWR